ncbi:hypothetical protein DH2020_027556 [Rehmannia glutinosa]|uniref:Endoglucanase n=1 Tax=Rehmannia glutinosa TaxID=99300 RepID=A0ABR0VXF1_REHGL
MHLKNQSSSSRDEVDLVGGYYDARDNVKFGLPMAFTSTLLAWSVIEFSDSMKNNNRLENAKDLYSDPSYSTKLLKTAMEVFDFADRYKGSYSDSLGSVACPFYCSYSGYHDELLWGASWLHRASEDDSYLAYIQSNGHTLGADEDDYSFSWDDKRAGTKILLSKGFFEDNIQQLQLYKAHSDNYICSLIPGSPNFQAQYTPGGLFYKGSESNLQYVTTSSFLLLAYAKYLRSHGGVASCGTSTITSDKLVALAKKQVDYILGNNPAKMSYMVGFGPRYPQHVHHRGSSLPSLHVHPAHISCGDGFQYLYSNSPNPNILVGAIVGGPDNRDHFADDRNNYQQSEPATYINAPFVGSLAFFSDETTGI